MSRVYWDTTLFIYLIEATPGYFKRVRLIHDQILKRGDELCTSVFTFGEVLTGMRKRNDQVGMKALREFMLSDEVTILPFTVEVADRYSSIRAGSRVSQADGIHLASASEAGIDLFFTNDDHLRKQNVPGIKFFADLDGKIV